MNDTHDNDTHDNDTHDNDTHDNDTHDNDTHDNDTHDNDTHDNDTHNTIKKCIEMMNNIKIKIEKENKELDILYNGNSDYKNEQYNNTINKLQNINIDDFVNSYNDFVCIVDPYHIKRAVINAYMKETYDSLKGDYSTLLLASNFVEKLLKYYNFSYRDSVLHDYVWNKHDDKSVLFKMKNNKILFSNSTDYEDINDKSLHQFLNSIVDNIKKYVQSNIKVKWIIKKDNRREIHWVLIIIKLIK
jgi:hypothetical protein